LWAFDILIEEGYRYDASVFPIHHDRYGIPPSPREPYVIRRQAGALIEAPGSAVRVGPLNLPVGGGGYFRLLPYGWTRWGLKRINDEERRGAIFYLHPWEIDPDQPRLPVGLLGGLRHYRNLKETEARLRQLLNDFRWAPLQTMLSGSIERVPDAARLTAALPYLW
jgi:polysaccharide deacetylase family protein (PEP-CTERM system associated)